MSLLIADQIGKNYQVGEVVIPALREVSFEIDPASFDRSYSLTPELLYSGFTNWELRFRTALIVGRRSTDFGEKQNDSRMELRIGYYF